MPDSPKPDYDESGEVLFDQLEFLIWGRVKHLAADRKCACEDCMRYTRVQAILMEPFGEKTESPAKSHQKTKKAGG